MNLVRLLDDPRLDEPASGHSFDKLYNQWAVQISTFGESIEEFARPYLDHARNICAESPPDERYGIYALEEDGEYCAFMHVNWAQIPGISDWTLRVLWIQSSPLFDYEDYSPDFIAKAVASILMGTEKLAREYPHKCGLIKIHIGNAYDRTYWSSYAAMLNASKVLGETVTCKLSGMWLHITR